MVTLQIIENGNCHYEPNSDEIKFQWIENVSLISLPLYYLPLHWLKATNFCTDEPS